MDKTTLKMVRSTVRLSQVELADLAKVSQQTITDIERGKVRPRLSTCIAIVDALNKKLREKEKEEITVESLDWNPL